ncbi:hypothetical protein BT67DRAFT_386262 [Trichocladium antarcticum]|uniref:Rhodopsin domain-containing protein n=1 Tax=Trichocladium antarcticum TaxID=1450529 RepID=A0AAN6ZBZ1_9PEZI|nr:hypothetical protein BT67DRAFT_386262 [Trichocladium antarcticum]
MADAREKPADHNRGAEILAVCGTMVALSLFTVVMRLWVRVRIVKHVGSDDWAIIAAMTVIFVEMMIIIPEVGYGAGRHVEYIDPPSNVIKGLHLNFITQPLCLVALCLTKVSVGLFLLRLTPSPKLRRFVIGTIGFTILSTTGNFLTVFFQCQPLAFAWDSSIEGGKCIPPAHLKFAAFFNSSVAVLTDVTFALLPIPMLWNVQMNWRVKTAVAGILSLGLFAAVSAIVKITFLSNYGEHGDFLYDSSDLTIWTTIEICAAIIAASIPALKPLFKTLLDSASARAHHYGSMYRGYVRDTADVSRTPKSDSAGGAPGFEMYDQAKFAPHANVGITCMNGSGSEESILPQAPPTTLGITKTTCITRTVAAPDVKGNS